MLKLFILLLLVAYHEQSIARYPVEHMVVLSRTGIKLAETIGTAESANEPNNISLYNKIVIHNHPFGRIPYFSASDVQFAAWNEVQAMIVVSPVGSHSFMACIADRSRLERWPNKDIYADTDPASANPYGYWQMDKTSKVNDVRDVWLAYFAHYNINYHCEVFN